MRNHSGNSGGFSRSTMRHRAGPGGRRRRNTVNLGRRLDRALRLLFHQLQQGTAALAFRRSFRGRLIGRHRIAQRLQVRVGNSVESGPEIENCHRDQQCSVATATVDEGSPALLEGCENRIQSFFRISHQLFFRYRACEVKSMRSSRTFHTPLHKLRISWRRHGGSRPPASRRARDWPMHRTDK